MIGASERSAASERGVTAARSFGGWRVEARQSIGPLSAVSVAVLTLAIAVLSDGVLGVRARAVIGYVAAYAMVFAGPFAAASAAWLAGRDARHGDIELFVVTSRLQVSRHCARVVPHLSWLWAGYGASVVVLSLRHLIGVGAGQVDLVLVLLGFVSIAAFALAGYVVGLILRHWVVPPLIALLVYVLLGIPGYTEMFVLLSPVVDEYPDPIRGINTNAALAQVGWMGCIAAVAVSLLLVVSSERRRTAQRVGVIALAAALVACVFCLSSLLDYPPTRMNAHAQSFTPVCDDRSPQTCVHPVYSRLLPVVADAVPAALSPLEGTDWYPDRVQQTAELPSLVADGPRRILRVHVAGTGDQGEAVRDGLVQAVVWNWGHGCAQDADNREPDAKDVVAAVLRLWDIKDDPGLLEAYVETGPEQRAARRMLALPPHARTRWLAEHMDELRACRLSMADLPS